VAVQDDVQVELDGGLVPAAHGVGAAGLALLLRAIARSPFGIAAWHGGRVLARSRKRDFQGISGTPGAEGLQAFTGQRNAGQARRDALDARGLDQVMARRGPRAALDPGLGGGC